MSHDNQIEATILRLGAKGDGIAQYEDKPLFVPLALPQEVVRVTLGRKAGEGMQATLTEVMTPSPHRIAPACPHFSQCGGCSLQHMDTATYQAFKRDIVVQALSYHKVECGDVREAIILPAHTRRRITLTALATKENKVILGFNARGSHFVVDVESCPIARPELVALFNPLRQALQPWVKSAKALDISMTHTATGVDIVITGKEPSLAAREALMPLAQYPSLARISWRAGERKPSEPVLGLRDAVIVIGGKAIPMPAGAFLQASTEAEAVLSELVLGAIKPDKNLLIGDLFSGLGTFSVPLTKLGHVVALESDGAAVAALRAAAHSKIEVMERDLFHDPLKGKELKRFTTIVFDPPRAGAEAQCKDLAKSNIATIIAVSCNPATFARDAAILIEEGGYTLEWVQPVDQFLWSDHVELVAKFSRAGKYD